MEEKKLYNAVRKIITLADGRQIEIETGKLAKQADGSVVVKMGDTMLLGTVVAAKDAKPDTDFMPLQVEYKEKYAAVGRFPGGFMKREARANDSEVLVARLIDRALRPLFPADYHAEVYVTVNLISADKDIQPDALAGLAASAALAVSDIPFGGPISEVRVVRRNGEYAINPTYSEMPECDLDIMVGGTIDNILMVEGEMKEVSEEVMLGAIKFAHEEIKKHCAVQIELSKELGKDVKRTYCHEVNDEELRQTIVRELYDKAYAIATSGTMKHEREDSLLTFPSVIYRHRSQRSASVLSWVTRMIVFPCSFIIFSRSNTRSRLASSRFPVGSSARISEHGFNSRRATAIRCCSPPEH